MATAWARLIEENSEVGMVAIRPQYLSASLSSPLFSGPKSNPTLPPVARHGSIIAAIPAVLLALIQLGIFPALHAAIAFIVVNLVIGTGIEPRVMGKGVGLSTLVVFLSLVFWGWVLGPVGMLLSVPLTMVVKIGLENNEGTRKIAVLLS